MPTLQALPQKKKKKRRQLGFPVTRDSGEGLREVRAIG